MTDSRLLMIFVKNPVLGKVKTRLAHTVGNEKALSVYLQLLAHTSTITSAITCNRVIFYADFIGLHDHWSERLYKKQLQQGRNLGERMHHAFAWAFGNEYKQVVIIGSDCFELSTAHINKAFDLLNSNDAVIGPAADGGYYLLGLTKLWPEIFSNKSWSSASVFADTMFDFQKLKIRVAQLEMLHDIDTEEDLKRISI